MLVVKISLVLGSLRSAFGAPQVPGSLAVLGLSALLTVHVMAPTAERVQSRAGAAVAVNSNTTFDANVVVTTGHTLTVGGVDVTAAGSTLTVAGRTVTITQPGAAVPYAVSGRVANNAGEPQSRVLLTFSRVSGVGEVPEAVFSDDDGNWSQTGFEPGTTYRVSASKSRQSFTPASLDFSGASASLNFTVVGRRIAIGIGQQ